MDWLEDYAQLEQMTPEGFRRFMLRSQRELDAKFDRFAQEQKHTLSKIELQVTTTNGRLQSLELWRAFLAGGLVVVGAMLVPMLVWALQGGR